MQKRVLFWLLFAVSSGFSQTDIKGLLVTEENKPVSGASVTITELSTNNILNYDISNSKGLYSIAINNKAEKLQLNIRSMGYKMLVKIIDNKPQTLNFTLQEEATELREVVIKSSPITKKGDTINYAVNAFAKQKDRTIADVLKNMPGIEVLNNGKILYQGKPINKYYIEGLDLLEGKYNLANKNLPHKEVSKVQVLENHQPVKILDSLVFSDKAAINIKLKNSYTFTGQAELGAGFSPLLWDANITPLLFTKKQQMLISYQTNNTGDNIASQLETLTIEDLIEQFENNTEKRDWLNIQQLSTPSFSEKRWLDNNIHLLSGNYLQKIKKDYELRLNTSYLNDYQQQNGVTKTVFFTPTDTISLLEEKHNQLFFNTLETNLTLQKNTKENYLKNSLQFQGYWDSQVGNIQTNNAPLTQNLSNRYFKLSNKFKTIFALGSQLATLNSYIGFNKTPQTLNVNPGQFDDLLNNGNSYEGVFQEVNLTTFYTNNALGFTKGWNRFIFSPEVGFQFEAQNLESQITTTENKTLPTEFNNNLNWRRSKFYFDLKTQYKTGKWRVELTTPLYFHSYQVEDKSLQESEHLNRLTFEPRLAVIYDTAFWKFNTSASIGNSFGTINQLHYAYILQNYRNIQRINSPLPQTFNKSISGGISYRNPIKSLFWNISFSQAKTQNNLLYQAQILENGATELQAIKQDNNRVSRSISTRLSKYYSNLNTSVTLNANFGLQDYQQILNTEITDIETENFGIGWKLDTDFTDWFNAEYNANWFFSKNKIQSRANNTIIQQTHLLNLNFYPKDNQYLAVKTEYIKNNLFAENDNNFFTNLVYRYTWEKKKIDFELQWENIFNTKNYKTVSVNEFSYVETNFRLRPRQVLLKVRFSL